MSVIGVLKKVWEFDVWIPLKVTSMNTVGEVPKGCLDIKWGPRLLLTTKQKILQNLLLSPTP